MSGGILGPFTPQTTAPTPKIIGLDQGTNQLIDQGIAQGQQTPEQFAQMQNQGVSSASEQPFQSSSQAQQADAAHGGYGQGSINEAIRGQYREQAGAGVQRLQDTYNKNAIFQKNAALQRASAEAMARQNVTTQSYARLMDSYNQTEAARAQVLSSILGGAGTAAGMAAGGGFGGKKKSSPTVQQQEQQQENGNSVGGGFGSYGME